MHRGTQTSSSTGGATLLRENTLREFHDATLDLAQPSAILAVMSRLLLARLDVAYFLYFEATGDGGRLAILDPTAETRFAASDRARLDRAFEALANRPDWTGTRVIHDERDTLKAADDPIAIIAGLMNVRAGINVPIVREQSRVAAMTVLATTPRRWTPDEIGLCEDLAGALWTSIARARAEAAIAERDAQFRVLAQNIPALCWLGDPDGRVYWVNAQWEEYFGALASNRGDLAQFVHPDHHRRAAAAWRAARASGEAIHITLDLRGVDGVHHPFRASSAPIFDAEGVLGGWCGTLVDLSERAAHDRRQSFLRAFHDATRDRTDASDILATVGQMMIAHMGIGQVTYTEVSDADPACFDVFLARPDRRLDEVAAPFRFGEGFEALLDCYARGRTLVAYDYYDELPELTAAVVAARRQVGMCASITVPLVKDGRLVAMLSAVEPGPRRWTRDEVALVEDLAERVWSVVSRARAEAALQERERNQAFLIDWTDAIRDEPDPAAILRITLARLGALFGVNRATFSEGDASGRRLHNRGEWLDGVASIAATVFDLDEVGETVAALWLGGAAVRYDDVTTDPRIPDVRRPFFAATEVRSLLTIPLIEAGKVRAALSLQSRAQRNWRSAEVALVRDVTERVWIAVERARVENKLQRRERNRAFLIDWSDRIRGETTPQAIVATTLDRLGRYLGVTRTTFAETDGTMFTVTHEWRDGVRSIQGNRFTLPAVGAAVDRQWRAGEVIRYDDVMSDPRLEPAAVERYRSRDIAAFVSVPLVRGGRMQSALSVQHVAARPWDEQDVQLIADVAERTWVALERAQAQAALQARERTQAFLVAWNDAVRGEANARSILARTVRMLAEHLDVARVNYAEPNHDLTAFRVIEEHCARTVPSVRGMTYRLADFGARLAAQQVSGRPVRIDDTADDPLFDDTNRPLFDAIGVRAALTVPMLRGSEIMAALSVQHDAPRRWTDAEVELLHDLADRTLAVLIRAQSEARLAESEAQLAAFIENAPIAMYLKDAEGRYLRVNREMAVVLDATVDDALGRTTHDFMPQAVAEEVSRLDRAALDGGVHSAELEIAGRTRYSYAQSLRFAVPAADGRPTRLGGFVIDLTERRHAEAALARSREALYQTEKLTALGSLLAGVSHELNNPLSIVVAQAVMMERQSQNSPLAERAQKIRRAADRCARIVQSFLAMARQKRPEREAIDLNAVVVAAHELTDYGLKNDGIATLRALTPGLPPISADSDQLHQIVINLIVNAQQAMAGASDADRTLTLRSGPGAAPGTVMLEIADTGPGVPAEVQRRIFEPFYTTKPQGQGTGVGLSFSQGLAEAHGGTLELMPAVRGACFRLTLPIGPNGPSTVQLPHVAPAPSPPARRALVIDDEQEIAEALADFLSLERFDCDMAVGGVAAKELLSDGDYDLIVSDLRMPGVDGPHLHTWLSAERPDLLDRIAFATGDTLGQNAARFLADLGRPVLEKPFTPEAVRRLLEQMDLA